MKKHTLYTGILASALFLAGSLFFSACSDEDMFDSSTTIPTGEGIFFGTAIGNGQWTPDVIGRSAKEEKQKPIVIEGEDGFSVTATVEDGIKLRNNEPKPQSRGTQVTQAAEVKAFDVAAYKNVNNTYEHYFTDKVADGVNPSEKRFWPSKGTVDFIATYPQGLFSGQFPTAAKYADGFSFNYTIKDNVEEQEDIMVACPKGLNNGQDGTAVPLQFQHLLAAVQFKVGKMQFIQIHSLKVTGVYGGDITFTNNNGVWVPSATTTTEYDLTDIIADTSGLIEGDEITSNKNNSIMLVAPQTLPEDAMIVVEYTETITGIKHTIGSTNGPKTAPLSGEWVAGKTTTYALNISGTDFGTVEIPRPEDQDAHYIMLNMSYNMGNILSNKNIISVKATAQWLTDENGNDISGNNSTKSGISLKFASELTPRQQSGYWTDKKFKQTVTITTGSEKEGDITEDTSTKDSQGYTGLRGGSTLNITQSKEDIVLFIEENNGTTDRIGKLLFTATLDTDVEIVLGEGQFKQLCPSWNDSNIGVERFEKSDEVPYGFSYKRYAKFEYDGEYNFTGLWGGLTALFVSRYITEGITADGNFIKFTKATAGWGILGQTYVKYIEVFYSALNNVYENANKSNGLTNTQYLYSLSNNQNISKVEEDIEALGYKKIEESGENTAPEIQAAFVAISSNRMYELEKTITSSQGTEVVTKPYLYKNDDGTNIIEWYLPSSEEAKTLVETGTGEEDTPISPLNGIYWSSTAGDDANAYAHSYTFTNNSFGSINESAGRMTGYKVRAVRKKP